MAMNNQNMMNMNNNMMDMNNPMMMNMFAQWMNTQAMTGMGMNNPMLMNMFLQWLMTQNININGMNMNNNNPFMMNNLQNMNNMNNMNNNFQNQNNFNMNNQNNFNMNNQQFQSYQNNNIGGINIIFCKDMTNYNIIANYSETLGSLIGKYINMTKDTNVNMYFFNGKKLNESLTVGEAGLMGGSMVNVVETKNILGAS
jgi:hypothetical protein